MIDGTVKYLSLLKLLKGRTFRIPDYQRGYAWGNKQLADLWSDLVNLQKGKLAYHYTGMITVEAIDSNKWKTWDDAYYYEQELSIPYSVVDGQQRLTSIIILMNEIINSFPDDQKIDGASKESCIRRYILRWDSDTPIKSFVFGYDTDNPSDLHFKTKILGYKEYLENSPQETAYTNNLSEAKAFFKEKVNDYLKEYNYDYSKLEELYIALLKKFRFDFKVLEKDLDIFMVFETMNTRGKVLSDLENLKNRLIYLATLIHHIEYRDTSSDKRNYLREIIVTGWKNIYGELGKSKRLMDSDDTLLRHHWVMYYGYDRQRAKFYAEDIFKQVFTVNEVITKALKKEKIEAYVSSLKNTAEWWFIINNPSHKAVENRVTNPSIISILTRISRLKFRFFAPLLFAGLQSSTATDEDKIDFLKAIENYIFLIFMVSYRRSNTGSYHFQALAHRLFNSEEYGLTNATASLDEWTYGGEDYYGYFDFENFRQYLEPLFEQDKGGYRAWAGMKFFLSEYISPQQTLEDWEKYKVVGLYTSAQKNREGFNHFIYDKNENKYTRRQKKYLEGSLGNYLFLKNPPPHFEKLSFGEIKSFLEKTNQGTDILQYEEWSPTAILDRGKRMLSFLENRWSTNKMATQEPLDKERLLYLDTLFMTQE